ncbi:peptidoglycan DD-metalloendopeptidase family protein [Cognatilysobacter bugurensis]|uniref:Lipoprotein n=1 Tax=Cognatilysobacter bugurensis TaxID=543356 RepID=A0A918STU6_9GAMM|nr:peptidoglycan DD-metalloendopeptidase family protein [Lysobacter bugurensis]GHA68961.1 lipoprotein [Lysobacter bugurensis]
MGMTRQWTLALAGALGLAACSTTVVREPVQNGGASASTPRYGESATVQRGDTLYGVATRNGVSVRDLAAWNGIAPPYTIYPGQRLRLHPSSGPAAAPGKRTVAAGPAKPVSRAPASPTRPRDTAAPAPKPAAPAAPPIQSGIAWRWPADGGLLNRFVTGDPTRQGIDIAGAGGAPVRAAADGTVVYSGSGLVGYGELVIIKHTDAWLSAYGHNRKRLVNEGQLVKAGEQIAEMGRSGASRDMLHFEVRYNGKPVDPLTYLPPR